MSITQVDPRIIEIDNKRVTVGQNKVNYDANDFILDEHWSRQAFLISDLQLTDTADKQNRYYSTASSKFTNTKMGGNLSVNPRPQFTRYCDIRSKGRYTKNRQDVSLSNIGGNYGMGRYYSESIDDSSQLIYMTFGVPQFNSLVNFISKAFDPNLATMARTGRGTSFFYDAARLAGTIVGAVTFPAFALTVVVGRTLQFLFGRSTSKFYNLKDTMHLYWSAVNTLTNVLAANRGIYFKVEDDGSILNNLIRSFLPSDIVPAKINRPYILDPDQLNELQRLMPDVFNEHGVFDIFAMANRAQRMSNQLMSYEYDSLNNGTATDYLGYLKKELSTDGTHANALMDNKGNISLGTKLNEIIKFSKYFGADLNNNTTLSDVDYRIDPNDPTGANKDIKKDPNMFREFFEYFDANIRDGGKFAVFKVDPTGSVNESFSNSVAESDLSSKLNGMSSTARQAKFLFANGNIVGETIKDIGAAIADVGLGLLDGVTLGFSSFVTNLAGNGYLDIPKYWQSSTANLPKSNYTIQLISPYGNPISQIQNIYIPLAMLLAGALPLSTGKASYTSPFICELYDRGRSQIKLGMIESLSITRGTTHLPFNINGNAMGIDVSFSIVDLSSIMHMPVTSGSVLGFDASLDEDNILSDYLAVLAGQDLYSQMYAIPRAKLKIAKTLMAVNRLASPAYWASTVHRSLPFANTIEGLVRGSSLVPGSQVN